MIQTILWCTDGSRYSEVAARYAADLAKGLRASVSMLHVVDIRLLEGPLLADIAGWIGADVYMAQLQAFRKLMEERGNAVLQASQQTFAQHGVPTTALLRTGHPAHVILEEALHTDLVVLGQRGEHAEWSGDITGSIMDRVTHRVRKPGLITPAEYRPIKRLLAAFDGSAHSQDALSLGIELAKALQSSLALVTVIEQGRSAGTVKDVLEQGVLTARTRGLEVEFSLCMEGVAATAILGAAHEKHCDMLVIGAYGHSRLRELVLGSTTAHLLSHARIPVLLAP
jgi:nucleotide-binding universal stress UspA family protein